MNSNPLPGRADFRFFDRLRVRWSEVDMMRVVFNSHYLGYFDVALTNYWRALGLPFTAALARRLGELFVRKATLEFHAPARLDDVLDIGLRCARIGNSSAHFQGAIFDGERLLVSTELIYVLADPDTSRPRSVGPELRAILEGFEAGEPATRLAGGDWGSLGEAARAVREAVFVEEQGIAREDEWDAADAEAWHVVVRNRLDQPLATGRLLPAHDGVAHVGRMAVLRPLRGSGLGAQVLAGLEQQARQRGDRVIVLSAQRHAEDFYRRLGYQAEGEPYEEVGIAHIAMRKRLAD